MEAREGGEVEAEVASRSSRCLAARSSIGEDSFDPGGVDEESDSSERDGTDGERDRADREDRREREGGRGPGGALVLCSLARIEHWRFSVADRRGHGAIWLARELVSLEIWKQGGREVLWGRSQIGAGVKSQWL